MWRKIAISLVVAAIATFSAWALADPTRGPVKEAVGYSGGSVAAPVKLPDGSVGAPALTFTADADLGIYRIGADIVGLSVGGVLQATFDASGMKLDDNLELTGGGSVVSTSNGDIVLAPNGSGIVDIRDAAVYVGDGTYSWTHSPTGLAIEGTAEFDAATYFDADSHYSNSYAAYFGSSDDYWHRYSSTATAFEFRSTDIDGLGTNGIIYEVRDGTKDLVCYGGILEKAAASDVASSVLFLQSGNAYHKATVNTGGAANLQCGGIGTKSMAVVQATAAGSTITITTTDAEGTYTSTTLTFVAGAPGANEIQCITDDATCAAAIVTYLASNVTGVTAEAVAAQVYLIPSDTMCSMGLSSADGGGTKFVLTNGVDGSVLLGSDLGFAADATYNIGTSTVQPANYYADAAGMFQVGGTTRLKASELRLVASAVVYWNGLTELRAPADGQTQFCNNAETQCFTLGASAADTMTLWDKAGTGAGSLIVTGQITAAGLLDSQAGRIINITTVNDANYTALVGDHLIAYTALTVARTVELPDALCDDGRTWDIKDEAGNAAAANIVIDPEGGTTIDGVANVSIVADYNTITVYCRNSVWFTR